MEVCDIDAGSSVDACISPGEVMAAEVEDRVCVCQAGRRGWSEMDSSCVRFPQANEKGKTTDTSARVLQADPLVTCECLCAWRQVWQKDFSGYS